MKRRRHGGFTLLEVILSTAILLSSMIVLMELASIGGDHVTSAEEMAAAQRYCQTKLNEILAGAAPATTVEDELPTGMPGWICSVQIESPAQPGLPQGLSALHVTVAEDVDGNQRADDETGKQFTLVHWIRDPLGAGGTAIGLPGGSQTGMGPFGRGNRDVGPFDSNMDGGRSLPPAEPPWRDLGGG